MRRLLTDPELRAHLAAALDDLAPDAGDDAPDLERRSS